MLTLRSPTIVRLLLVAVPQVKKYGKKIYPQATPKALLFFNRHQFREKRNPRFLNFVCPTTQLLKLKHMILMRPLCQHLLLTMCSIPTSIELNDSKCK